MDHQSIKNFSEEEEKNIEEANFNSRILELELREYDSYLNYREYWSRAILIFVISILTFNIVFIAMVGWGIWKYSDPWVARLIFTGNFVEILGLAKILVDYLFPTKTFPAEKDGSSNKPAIINKIKASKK